MRLPFAVYVAGVLLKRTGAAAGWDYLDQGLSWTGPGGAPALGQCGDVQVGQSPLDFGDATTSFSVGLSEVRHSDPVERFWYRYPLLKDPARLVNDGHTVGITFPETYKAGFSPSGASSVADMLSAQNFFRLYKLTVHSPSEHTLNGVQFPLEIQLVHQNGLTMRTGIVSIWFTSQSGASAPLLDALLESGLPQQPYGERQINLHGGGGAAPAVSFNTPAEPAPPDPSGFNLGDVVNADGVGFLHYNGTLTEPPCEDKVQWYLRAAPIPASAQQIQQFQQFIAGINGPGGNARPTQQTLDRKVVRMDSVDSTSPLALQPPNDPDEAPVAAVLEVPCADLPVFTSLVNPDPTLGVIVPEAVITGKEEFAKAHQDAVMSRNWYTGANQAYIEAKALYDHAPGLVEKIELQWNLIAMKDGLVAARASRDSTGLTAEQACARVLVTVCCFHSDSVECQNALGTTTCPNATTVSADITVTATASAAANATNATNATAEPAEPSKDFREPLPGEVLLPNGPAASPFSNEVAERVPRIGRGKMSAGYKDLSNSLRTRQEPGAGMVALRTEHATARPLGVHWLRARRSAGPTVWELD